MSEATKTATRLLLRAAVGAMLGGFLAGVWVLTGVNRTYQSEASLLFPLPASTLPGNQSAIASLLGAGSEVPDGSQFPLNTYKALLVSSPVLTGVAEELRIGEILHLGSAQEAVKALRQMIGVEITVDRTIRLTAHVGGTPRVRALSDLWNGGAALQRDLPHRQLAQNLLAAAIAQLRIVADQMQVDTDKAAVDSLERQLAEAVAQYTVTSDELLALQDRTQVIDGPGYGTEITKSLIEQRQTLREVDADLDGLQAELGQRQGTLAKASANIESLPEDSPFLVDLRARLRDAERRLATARQAYGPQNASVLAAQTEAERLRKELHRAANQLQEGYQTDVMDLKARMAYRKAERAQLMTSISGLEQTIRGLAPDLAELLELQATAQAQAKQIEQLKVSLAAARNRYAASAQRWRVLDEPVLPLNKSGPRTMASIFVGALVGAFVALAISSATLYRTVVGLLEPGDDEVAEQASAT